MNRRHFLGCSLALSGAVAGRGSLSFLRRHLGVRADQPDEPAPIAPRATDVAARVSDVDGATVEVELVERESGPPLELRVLRRGYPAGHVTSEHTSGPISFEGAEQQTSMSITVPRQDGEFGPWFYEVYVERAKRHAGDQPVSGFVCESAPYAWRDRPAAGVRRADRVAEDRGVGRHGGFTRDRAANDYVLTYRWHDDWQRRWSTKYRVRRSTHEAAVARDRGYVKTFEESLVNPVARDVARTLLTEATPDGVVTSPSDQQEDAREAIPAAPEPEVDQRPDPKTAPSSLASFSHGDMFDFLVRFVQDLRYVRDFESTDRFDYNRTVEETLVSGLGDCKDKTCLLAGLLAAPPLACATVLLFQPAHVLLGVVADDVPALPYDVELIDLDDRSVLPVEPSLRFPPGTYPDAPITAAYGDGDWFYVDVAALGRSTDRMMADWYGNAGPGAR